MARRAVIAFLVGVAAASSVPAGSRADFTLGLTGEWLGDEQRLGEVTSERDTLRAAITLAVDGYLSDARILAYSGWVQVAAVDVNSTEAGAGVDRVVDDYRTDQTLYGLNLRALSAFPVSFGIGGFRSRDDVTGVPRGGLTAGTRTQFNGDVTLTLKPAFSATVSYLDSEFEADDPETLRDETLNVGRFSAGLGAGLFSARLDARHEEREFFSQRQRQELDVGLADLAFDGAGPGRFQILGSGNRVRTAVDQDAFGDWTEVWRGLTRYTYGFSGRGYLQARAEYQQTTGPAGDFNAWSGGLTLIRDLSEEFTLDVDASYLRAEDELGGYVTQPVATVGLAWSRDRERWSIVLHPRVSYIEVRDQDDNRSSSTGGRLFVAVHRRTRGGVWGFEGEAADNQLSIAPISPDDPGTGASFLSGLETERQWARLFVSTRIAARTFLYASADARRRVRLDLENEVTEETAQGTLGVTWRTFSLRAGYTESEITGGDLPSMFTVVDGRLSWMPRPWLVLEARGYREEREAEQSLGTLDVAEAGIRFQYARLAFYARVRDQTSSGDGVPTRDDRRYWVGFERTFGFTLGGGNRDDRRAQGWGP